jgi:hypothetical protein
VNIDHLAAATEKESAGAVALALLFVGTKHKGAYGHSRAYAKLARWFMIPFETGREPRCRESDGL